MGHYKYSLMNAASFIFGEKNGDEWSFGGSGCVDRGDIIEIMQGL